MLNPQMTRVYQSFDKTRVENVDAAVREEINRIQPNLKPGKKIAVAVGSRGIASLPQIVRAVVDTIRAYGAEPFIIPAMGSHGGATAEGQEAVLRGYGITEKTVGVPIRSSMQVTALDSEGLLCRLYMDTFAAQADGIVVINRIKPHTDFHGPVESGLLKMCVIGLGKHAQAIEMHSFGVYGLRELIPTAARRVLETGKILFGVGVAENAYDQIGLVKAALPCDMENTEREMLAWSRSHMPSLPLDAVDVLLIDRMGKDISGVGIDTNVIGRMGIRGEDERLAVRAIIVDDLTDESHGNALGVGLADFITEKLRTKIDYQATYENVLTSTFERRGFLPIVASNPAQALVFAMRLNGRKTLENAVILRIRDTLHTSELLVSDAALELLKKRSGMTVGEKGISLFDSHGELTPWR